MAEQMEDGFVEHSDTELMTKLVRKEPFQKYKVRLETAAEEEAKQAPAWELRRKEVKEVSARVLKLEGAILKKKMADDKKRIMDELVEASERSRL